MHVLVCLHRCMQLQVLDGYLQAMVQTCMYRVSPICGYIVNYTHVCIQCGPFRGIVPVFMAGLQARNTYQYVWGVCQSTERPWSGYRWAVRSNCSG